LNNETPPAASDRTEDYLSAWMASVCDVLEKITGKAFTSADLSPQEVVQQAGTLKAEGSWLRFTVQSAGEAASPLKGEHSIGIGKPDALRLAQILMGEPFDGTQGFSSDYQDALDEIFRQFAGTTALALKPPMGGEVNVQLTGHDPGSWKPQLQRGFHLKDEEDVQFPLVVLLDPDLGKSLAPGASGKPARRPDTPVQFTPPTPAATSKSNRNIDLLLDVELPVALRFGKSEMPLSSILGLSPGAVVELDQKIMEPVELLVGGKTVAQGEVVVMEGHYALRVTEVLNPLERLESLQQ